MNNYDEKDPHDLEVTIKYRDGKNKTFLVDWETISTVKELYNVSVLEETYKIALADRNNHSTAGII